MKIWMVLFCGFLCFSMAGVGLAQMDRSEEIAGFMKALSSSSRSQRVESAKRITRAGIVDGELYEKIAGLLKAHYSESIEANHVDEMSWLCKALAASGDSKYKDLLSEIASNSQSTKLQHYATESLSLIEEYAQRSQILNAADTWDPELSAEENRQLNMLNSDKITLKRDAAKMIIRGTQVHTKVYEAVAEQLDKILEQKDPDSQTLDTLAWFCKTLGASGNRQYLDVLKRVGGKTQSLKLQEYASRAIRELE